MVCLIYYGYTHITVRAEISISYSIIFCDFRMADRLANPCLIFYWFVVSVGFFMVFEIHTDQERKYEGQGEKRGVRE